ncbi:DUF192 domain-containing protein [Paenalcaligenes niemegkensis]|uniref:DUF192 domain-containing protein n=1 Tax=Paenalcaligenes niemegkensis TaxID=2895469 RepID=UPI001EE808E8|nr:DUF192 domain-containing protein [Paenalcaligenes niemegkensis]MCQ9616615.1 DUF192 domain-containing protein [Paenalcaligenes niemegkensis]
MPLKPVHGQSSSASLVKLETTEISIDNKTIKVELASTPEERATGLMHRKYLAADEGMLFSFETVSRPCFWMKNTLIPLSIAFIDEQGVIINISEMQPESLEAHCPELPVRYALEMNEKWFLYHNIAPGAVIEQLPSPPLQNPAGP